MFKKIFILINQKTRNKLYFTHIITRVIDLHKILLILIITKNNAYYQNFKSNLC